MEIHLLMALRDACAYNLDGEFDELFKRCTNRKVYIDAVICAVKAPIAQGIVLDSEVMEGSEGEAQGEAGATSHASSFIKIYAYAVHISDCLSSKMADAYLL